MSKRDTSWAIITIGPGDTTYAKLVLRALFDLQVDSGPMRASTLRVEILADPACFLTSTWAHRKHKELRPNTPQACDSVEGPEIFSSNAAATGSLF